MKARLVTGMGALALGVAWGCASAPNPVVEAVRAEYRSVSVEPEVGQYAALQLDDARKSVIRLDRAAQSGASDAELDHLAYVARTRLDIARADGADGALQARVKELGQQRDKLMLEAHNSQTQAAQSEADRLRSELAMRDAEQQAELARSREGAQQLQNENAQLQARETAEGIVLRMGDVFFATNDDELLPGSRDLVSRVAGYLNKFPDRQIEVIGHTDSRGSAAYNRKLSERRAESVASLLRDEGVAADRIRVMGEGASKPVAPNSNVAGRQQNRRVEIVLRNPVAPHKRPPMEQPGGD